MARMELHRHIPSIINLAGEFIRIWYPNQPKPGRNCGSKDHLVKNCSSVRCLNCEQPGHHFDDCSELLMCGMCKGFDHSIADCPYVIYSANVAAKAKTGSDSKSDGADGEEEKQRAKKKQEDLKAEQEKMKVERRKKDQQQHLERQSHEEKGEKGRGQCGDERRHDEKSRDEQPRMRSRGKAARGAVTR